MRRYLDYMLAALVALLIGIGVDAGSVMYASASQTNYGTVLSPAVQSLPYHPPTAVSPVRPESTRTVLVHGLLASNSLYRIISGDTLSGIANRTYGDYKYWPGIYGANKSIIHNPNLIFPGQVITIPGKLSATAVPVTEKLASPSHHTTSLRRKSRTAVYSGSLHGTLSCSGLEALWLAAGGRSSAAFIAAEIATAESGGNQFAHSPTNDFGYWQINGGHGPSQATFDPMGNARAAVSISGDGTNWSPWTTYTSGAYRGKCSGSASVSLTVTRISGTSRASRAFAWALTQAGKWYAWGGTGPGTYDCSGLVMRAYQHAGIQLPRTTYEMLASRHLRRTYRPVKGDLAFYGSGHVELYAGGSRTFGAHQTGERIGYVNEWETPTYYTVS